MAKPEFAQVDVATASVAVRSQTQLPERLGMVPVPAYQDETGIAEYGWAGSLDVAGTTPTTLPDLLRQISREAGRMARDPFNALDNNPFIMREWLIVQQVLHTAASSMEKRFEALFLGL